MYVVLVVFLLAVVQSLFGVGLLLFGTPTLLLMGLSFQEALQVLLPASLTLSILQLWADGMNDTVKPSLAIWPLPGLAIGLWIALESGFDIKLELIAAILLVISATLRLSGGVSLRVRALMRRSNRVAMAVIGLVHGLTNLGGSLLTDYASTCEEDKKRCRQFIAFGYAIFAFTQIVLITIFKGYSTWSITSLGYAVLGGVIYMALGRHVFFKFSQQRYSIALSIFMLCCASVLTAKYFQLFPTVHS
ncbi:hypothetical protein C5U62_32625 [Pseudomonas protegens]|uniref:Probable membrane transporter protein n=1 Tax=Pseudomonas protegens TaxID=380021 RepID=A0A2T6GAZ7_9PSED|nr:TSUP family transporter [Pseudomonas protegens]PUA41321.1 hypothetical protein C5U62_32625 [Pseudomonas protegens]